MIADVPSIGGRGNLREMPIVGFPGSMPGGGLNFTTLYFARAVKTPSEPGRFLDVVTFGSLPNSVRKGC